MNAKRQELLTWLVGEQFKKYPGVIRIPGPTLASMMVQDLNPHSLEWSNTCYEVANFLEEQIKAGSLIRTKGPRGGISFPQDKVETIPAPAINNHICPCCKNDRVSKSERTCWKCGGAL